MFRATKNAAGIIRAELCRSASHHRGSARELFTRLDTGLCSIQLDAALPSIKLLATGIGDPNSVGSAFAVFFQ